MVTAEGTGGEEEIEQIPVDRNVRPRQSSSAAWEYFTQFTTGDGRRKARCKKCNRELAAESTNGTSRLLRHAGRCYQLQMPRRPRATPAVVPPSFAPSHPDEHESNQLLVVIPSSDPPSSLSNILATLHLPDDDDGVQSLLQHSQSYHQVSSPSASFFDGLPPTVQPAPAQPSIDPIDPPPPVPQTVPLTCPPSSHSDDEVLPDRQHGWEDYEEASNHLILTSLPDENESNQLSVTVSTMSVNASSNSPSSSSNNLASFRLHDDDMQLQPMQISQPHYQQSSSTPSYPTDLPPTPACDPPAPALPQHCIDPPLSVPQTDPLPPLPSSSNDPPMSFPPSQLDEVLTDDREHGMEGDEESSNHLAKLIALHGYNPALVENACFKSFVGSLNPRFRFPSRLTVEQMCDDIFDEAREGLLSRLSRSNRKVSLAVGTAQTIHGEVLYTACRFIDDEWNLHQVVLDAYQVAELPILHGPLLGVSEVSFLSGFCDRAANVILRDFLKHGLLDKLFAMVWSIKDSGEIQRHMKQFISVDITRCVDNVLHGIAGPPMMLDPNFIIDIYNEVDALDLTRESLQQFFSKHGLDHLKIHNTYWYSSYCSLMFLRKPGSCTIANKDYSQLVELLCKIWGVIYHAIQRISNFRHPSSNQCLVELFKVREVLQSELERTDGDNSVVCRGYKVFKNRNDDVVDVLREAKDTLDSTLQDIYLVWSVPLVLDPRYKLTYIKFIFIRAFGSRGARYISEVTRKMKKIYADYVEYDDAIINGASSDGVIDEMAAGSSTAPLGQAYNEHCRSGDEMMDDIASHQDVDEIMRSLKDLIIDPLGQAWDKHCRSLDGRTDAGIYQNAEKELERYLNDPRVEATQDFDILNWWKDNNSKYPTVARMARDALAMPTCSKLSSEQMAQVSSIIRGYSKKR